MVGYNLSSEVTLAMMSFMKTQGHIKGIMDSNLSQLLADWMILCNLSETQFPSLQNEHNHDTYS